MTFVLTSSADRHDRWVSRRKRFRSPSLALPAYEIANGVAHGRPAVNNGPLKAGCAALCVERSYDKNAGVVGDCLYKALTWARGIVGTFLTLLMKVRGVQTAPYGSRTCNAAAMYFDARVRSGPAVPEHLKSGRVLWNCHSRTEFDKASVSVAKDSEHADGAVLAHTTTDPMDTPLLVNNDSPVGAAA